MEFRKFRHEYKFFITYGDYLALKARLNAVAQLDPNTGEEGRYFIRSLYFDNVYDSALKDKVNGVNNREKFRIRCYNRDESFVRLEKKSKINGLCNKIQARLTREEAEKIICGDLDWMKDSGRALVVEFYAKMRFGLLRPKVIVDYTRESYIFKAGNVRITFDYNIKTGLYNLNMFDFEEPTVTAQAESILLEVKYDAFLPEVIQSALQEGGRRSGSFSKYGSCRIYG